MQQKEFLLKIAKKFQCGYWWSLGGSILFECSHIMHHMLLLYVFRSHYYGLLGSIFSIVYVVINIVDFGFESSFAPFLHIVTQDKESFKKIFPLYVIPQIFIFSLGALIASWFYQGLIWHPSQTIALPFIMLLLVSEGIRIFFRRFLHNIFFNKTTVLIEQVLMIIYYMVVWLPYLYGVPLTFNLVFIPHLITSLFVLGLFIRLTKRFYQTLPQGEGKIPKDIWKRIFRARYFNYLVTVETFLISGNFLAPFFAMTFGFSQAGLFKIASIVAHSIQALVKAAIHFPGAALLAGIKTKPFSMRVQAFYTLSKKLNMLIVFITIFLVVNHNSFLLFYPLTPAAKSAVWYAFLFIGTTLLHQFFVVYEQFYIIEEQANKLFFLKSIEFLLFYFLIFANTQVTPLMTLVNIALIQIFSFALLALHAYARWHIKPYLMVTFRYLVGSIVISLSFSFILHKLAQVFQ